MKGEYELEINEDMWAKIIDIAYESRKKKISIQSKVKFPATWTK